MNKIILVLLFACAASPVYSQNFRKVRAAITAGYVMGTGDGAGGGGLITVEPGYRITDAILANVRLERVVLVRGTDENSSLELDYGRMLNVSANFQYYINNGLVRPFVGAGFGTYKIDAMTVDVSKIPTDVQGESKLGWYPRVGCDIVHFTISLDYNIVPPSRVGTNEFKNNYVAIRIGAFFGGGRKN